MNGPFRIFSSDVVDRVRSAGNVWQLPGGQLVLPRVFGFCRGVTRAMAMLQEALNADAGKGTRFFLLGQIIHNPWVNRYFEGRGVQILDPSQIERLEEVIGPDNCGVIPAFGVPLEIEDHLRAIGCGIVDTTCGDVRRLWAWARHAVAEGFGVLIYGRAQHDETVVTKSRLDAVGGKYLVVGDLKQAAQFCQLIVGGRDTADPAEVFGRQATNADSLQPFLRLAQVSQTTMLYDETMQVRDLIQGAFEQRLGPRAAGRLLFQPTVCRATQQRQAAATELCQAGCDLVLVVGGFGSSNTRHLYELARSRGAAYFIEDASGIVDGGLLQSYDPACDTPAQIRGWLPARRPLKIGVLAGASSPEVVVGEVLQRMASLLE